MQHGAPVLLTTVRLDAFRGDSELLPGRRMSVGGKLGFVDGHLLNTRVTGHYAARNAGEMACTAGGFLAAARQH